MSQATTILKGVVRGRTIELEDETHLPDGQEVEVTVHPIATTPQVPGDGIRSSAGGWSDDPDGVDEFVKWTYEQRRLADRPEIPDG